MLTKRGKQASRKAAARKYGFLQVPIRLGTFYRIMDYSMALLTMTEEYHETCIHIRMVVHLCCLC
ncbi:MAG: hypothetical protein Q8K59_08905 [Nitrosomonas sp.]|nr:hypothetical protein [Nitrosomonas sp.]